MFFFSKHFSRLTHRAYTETLHITMWNAQTRTTTVITVKKIRLVRRKEKAA